MLVVATAIARWRAVNTGHRCRAPHRRHRSDDIGLRGRDRHPLPVGRVVHDAEPRNVLLSRVSIGLAVAVIIASVSMTYVAGVADRPNH